MRTPNATTLIQLAALVALVWLSFGHILGGYFLADDIWQVPYAGRIADGNFKMLWENFTGNFMHISSSAVYRPLITLSMVVDYLAWKVNAFGYLLTNLLWYTADVVLVFLTARILW